MEFVSKDEMDAHGWAEMSDIEKRLNFAEDDWAYDTRNLTTSYADELLRFVNDKIAKYQKNKAALTQLNAVKSNLEKQKGKEDLILRLDELKAAEMPTKELSEAEFLESGFDEIINKKDFLEHFKGKDDEASRLSHLKFIEPTRKEPDAVLKMEDKGTKELRKAFLKVFESADKRKFYVFLTDYNNDKIGISGYPISKTNKVKSFVRKALEVLNVNK